VEYIGPLFNAYSSSITSPASMSSEALRYLKK
jgi:hypothetical protein